VLEDANMGRRYLPSEWLDQPVKTDDIANINPSCKESIVFAIQKLLFLSEKYYLSALTGTKLLPVRSRFAIIVALRIYRAIGTKLAKNNFNWWMGRTIVSKWSKFILTLRSLIDLATIRTVPHDKNLHIHLKGLSGVDY
jgi:phytoene synthase